MCPPISFPQIVDQLQKRGIPVQNRRQRSTIIGSERALACDEMAIMTELGGPTSATSVWSCSTSKDFGATSDVRESIIRPRSRVTHARHQHPLRDQAVKSNFGDAAKEDLLERAASRRRPSCSSFMPAKTLDAGTKFAASRSLVSRRGRKRCSRKSDRGRFTRQGLEQHYGGDSARARVAGDETESRKTISRNASKPC